MHRKRRKQSLLQLISLLLLLTSGSPFFLGVSNSAALELLDPTIDSHCTLTTVKPERRAKTSHLSPAAERFKLSCHSLEALANFLEKKQQFPEAVNGTNIQELELHCSNNQKKDDKYRIFKAGESKSLLQNISHFSLRNCDATTIDLAHHLFPAFSNLDTLDFGHNGLHFVDWHMFALPRSVQTVNFSQNLLDCDDCRNQWLWELLHEMDHSYLMNHPRLMARQQQLRTVFEDLLPTSAHLIVDPYFLKKCSFDHCSMESAHFTSPKRVITDLGAPLELRCSLKTHESAKAALTKDMLNNIFRWPLSLTNVDDAEKEISLIANSSANTSEVMLKLNSTSSKVLGFVFCRCLHCTMPVYDVAEIRFFTPLSIKHVHGAESVDPLEEHFVVKGYPLDTMTVTITRAGDNHTEIHEFEEDRVEEDTRVIGFFNDSLFVRYEKGLSYFFLKYLSIYIHQCQECEHSQVGQNYRVEICGGNHNKTDSLNSSITQVTDRNCASIHHYFGPIVTSSVVPMLVGDSSRRVRTTPIPMIILIVVTIFGAFITVVVYFFWQTGRKIFIREKLRRGYRKSLSRQTDETSIPLGELTPSQTASGLYIRQFVPVINSRELRLREKIGKGAYGEVFVAEWAPLPLSKGDSGCLNASEKSSIITSIGSSDGDRPQPKTVAVKMLYNVHNMDEEMEKEAAVLAKLDHANIIRMYGVCYWNSQIALVLEMMNQGDLKSYLKNRMPRCDNYSQFPPALLQTELVNMCLQICQGLSYVHSKNIVHRDLAARNCLVSGESDLTLCSAAFRPPFTIKISDFGMSRSIYMAEYYRLQKKSTALPVRWLPPECFKNPPIFSKQSDMWSFGIVLFEIFTYGSILPYSNLSNNEVLAAVSAGIRPEFPESQRCPTELIDLMKSCWRISPQKRINTEEALDLLKTL